MSTYLACSRLFKNQNALLHVHIDIQYTTGLEICQGHSAGAASLFGPNLRQASVRPHSGPATEYFAGAGDIP